jgi:hypothetical protein
MLPVKHRDNFTICIVQTAYHKNDILSGVRSQELCRMEKGMGEQIAQFLGLLGCLITIMMMR